MANTSPGNHDAARRRIPMRRARASLSLLTLLVGCVSSVDPGCSVDLSSCSSDSDCPGGFAVLYFGPPDCQVDVCREGRCTQEAVPDGTKHEPQAFRWRDEERWCTRHVCVSGAVTSIEDATHLPADTKCERYSCSGKQLVTEHLCIGLDGSSEDAADGDVATDASTETDVDADADDAPESAIDAPDDGAAEDDAADSD